MINNKLNIETVISDKLDSDKYLLKMGEAILGYSYVFLGKKNNNIYVFINEKDRSNGYGSFLFNEMIEIIKKSNKPHLLFDIDKSNYSANSIIHKFGGTLLAEDEKAHWVLKL